MMTDTHYSMTDILNLATAVKELAAFQNSVVWSDEPFTANFLFEYSQVLQDKAQQLEDMIQEIELKVVIKQRSIEGSLTQTP
ncbi:hypothetical protein ABT56_20960 [Photobacterium aquae]|uniref:Uncharacterized protein n=1 Tax=Photobacterium aquae TaxID=1195763 RepID=A0A0J1GT75_9GAMM|nr:hypothetical protein [Photobacterium aquae]KLV02928.1 hypothetical protein ABT56_20960 [Photobacterium aquae]